jgi:polynucleotide 5'-kinase involved in rRNA processing
MLPALVGAARLVQAAQSLGTGVIVYDTCGLVEASVGGLALILAEIELLQPSAILAIQRERELEPLLIPLRKSRRVRVENLRPSELARRRNPAVRRLHRAEQFARYFSGADMLILDWSKVAIFPHPQFSLHRLAALEDAQGFTLGLGIICEIDRFNRRLTLLSPLPSLDGVNALRVGDLAVDPVTFHDETPR